MKALFYISFITILIFSSCSSSLYMGAEYDDLYYTSSDAQRSVVSQSINNGPLAGSQVTSDIYYDNIYASDTLIAEQYINAADYNDEVILYDDNDQSAFEYDNGLSYSGRLRSFYGNYFDPFWRDPWYYGGLGFGSSFGYGFDYGYPYYGSGFRNSLFYNPYDYYSSYYSGYYGGYYGSYYGGYYGSYYNSYFNPYYGYYSGNYSYNENNTNQIIRRDRYSTLSDTYSGSSVQKASTDLAGESSRRAVTGTQNAVVDSRRVSSVTNSSATSVTAPATANPAISGSENRRNTSTQAITATPAVEQPEYESSGRTYTPSYTNPRLSTRPVYNNTQTGTTSVPANNQVQSVTRSSVPSTGSSVTNSGVSNSTVRSSTVTTRPASSVSSSSSTYSVPSRRASEVSSGFSTGSGSSGSFNTGVSRSSSSSSSYSSGSSGSSGSSVSSGSSGSSVGRSSSSSSGSRR